MSEEIDVYIERAIILIVSEQHMLKFAKFIGANTDFSTAQAFLFPRVPTEAPEEPIFGLVVSGASTSRRPSSYSAEAE